MVAEFVAGVVDPDTGTVLKKLAPMKRDGDWGKDRGGDGDVDDAGDDDCSGGL